MIRQRPQRWCGIFPHDSPFRLYNLVLYRELGTHGMVSPHSCLLDVTWQPLFACTWPPHRLTAAIHSSRFVFKPLGRTKALTHMQITASGAGIRIMTALAAASRGRPPSPLAYTDTHNGAKYVWAFVAVSLHRQTPWRTASFNQAKGYAIPKCILEWEIVTPSNQSNSSHPVER